MQPLSAEDMEVKATGLLKDLFDWIDKNYTELKRGYLDGRHGVHK